MGAWSSADLALIEIQMTDSAEDVAGSWRYEHLNGPGHWTQLDAPGQARISDRGSYLRMHPHLTEVVIMTHVVRVAP